jgi:hypothetical protein
MLKEGSFVATFLSIKLPSPIRGNKSVWAGSFATMNQSSFVVEHASTLETSGSSTSGVASLVCQGGPPKGKTLGRVHCSIATAHPVTHLPPPLSSTSFRQHSIVGAGNGVAVLTRVVVVAPAFGLGQVGGEQAGQRGETSLAVVAEHVADEEDTLR